MVDCSYDFYCDACVCQLLKMSLDNILYMDKFQSLLLSCVCIQNCILESYKAAICCMHICQNLQDVVSKCVIFKKYLML